jgi:acetate kinase
MYIHRLKKYIGSYAVVLGGIDILIFTDDIGVHNWLVREKVCENMDWCGIKIDYKKNSEAITDNISQINSEDSKVKILSIPTEEEYEIFYEGLKLIEGSPK